MAIRAIANSGLVRTVRGTVRSAYHKWWPFTSLILFDLRLPRVMDEKLIHEAILRLSRCIMARSFGFLGTCGSSCLLSLSMSTSCADHEQYQIPGV